MPSSRPVYEGVAGLSLIRSPLRRLAPAAAHVRMAVDSDHVNPCDPVITHADSGALACSGDVYVYDTTTGLLTLQGLPLPTPRALSSSN